jgi:hypothetical protein
MAAVALCFRNRRSVPPFAFGDPSLRSGTGSTERRFRKGAGSARSPPRELHQGMDDNSCIKYISNPAFLIVVTPQE